jgi:hypothetical protein
METISIVNNLLPHLDITPLQCVSPVNGNIVPGCLCGVNINISLGAGKLYRSNKDLITNYFNKYRIPLTRDNLQVLAKIVIETLVELCQNNSGIQRVPSKDLLYRFVDPSEYSYYNTGVTYSLQNLYDWGLINQRNIPTRNFTFTIYPAVYHLRSTGKNYISLKQYLGSSKGVGGQISGWQSFDETPSATLQSTIGTVRGAYDSFSNYGQRNLFILPYTSLQQHPLEIVDIPGKIPLYEGDYDPVGGIIVYPSPNKIRIFRGGAAMPDDYANYAELDMVGDIDLHGYIVVPDQSHPITYELIVSALNHSNLL